MSTGDLVDFDLSPIQAGILFESLIRPGAYIEQRRLTFTGRLNVDALERAWHTVIDRHDALRTVVRWSVDGTPRQAVRPAISGGGWQIHDMSDPAADIEQYVAEDRAMGFDLDGGSLTRAALLRTTPTDYELLWTFHHLLLDGRSVALIVSELLRCYSAYASGATLDLTPPRQASEYADWLRSQDPTQCRDFWARRLAGFTAPSLIGGNRVARDRLAEGDVDQHCIDVDVGLASITAGLRTTPNALVTACWLLVLAERNGHRDVTCGITLSVPFPVAHADAPLASLCIGTVPLRATVDPSMRVVDWLRLVHLEIAETMRFAWQSTPEIKKLAGIRTDMPLFDSILVFPHGRRGFRRQTMADGVRVVRRLNTAAAAGVPLVLSAVAEERVELEFSFDPTVLEGNDIVGMSARMVGLLVACGNANTVGELIAKAASRRQLC